MFVICALFLSCFSFFQLSAVSIDGTVTPSFLEVQYTGFTSGDSARGFVHFTKGFRLPANGTVSLSLAKTPVGGEIDLNNGTLILDDELFLNAGTTFVGTGTIVGNGNAVHFLGNVKLLDGELRLTMTGLRNTITLDGHCHTLEVRRSSLVSGSFVKRSFPFESVPLPQEVGLYMRNLTFNFLSSRGPGGELNNAHGTFVTSTHTTVTFDGVFMGLDLVRLEAATTMMNSVALLSLNAIAFLGVQNPLLKNPLIHSFSTFEMPPGSSMFFDNHIFNFLDSSSRILMDGAALTFVGVGNQRLQRGRLISKGVNLINTDPPITLGDGVTSTNDFTLQILPSSSLTISARSGVDGRLIINNTT